MNEPNPITVDLLVVGGESDPNTQRIVDQAHFRGINYFFHDTDQPHASRIAWDLNRVTIDLQNTRLVPRAIYARCNVFPQPTAGCNWIHESIQAYALCWPHIRILNRRSLANRNIKADNLRRAIEVGFQIPETIVLGELSPLATLPQPESWIVKPLNGGSTTVLASELVSVPDQPIRQNGPWFLQRRLAGENLRVFVIGGEAFGFHLRSDKLDYRNDHQVQVRFIEVPANLVSPAKTLAEQNGFDYCALDFRCVSGFDDPVFLEINSFPMFVRFDDAAENKLADQILDFLLAPSSKPVA